VALAAGSVSLWAVVAGVFLLNVGAQGLQVTHQSVIYRLAPHARSRITSVYMTSGFIGASCGSALASGSFAVTGWTGLCILGGALPLGLLLTWPVRRPRSGAVL
jgi:hypothetical protein